MYLADFIQIIRCKNLTKSALSTHQLSKKMLIIEINYSRQLNFLYRLFTKGLHMNILVAVTFFIAYAKTTTYS